MSLPRIGLGWARLATIVRAHPGRVLGIGMLLLVPPAAAAAKSNYTYNVLAELPPASDSVRGYDALSRHFDRGEIGPLVVVVSGERSLWDDASFRAINDVTVALGKVGGVATVRSITQPTGGVFSEEDLAEAGAGDLAAFPDRLQEGADGVARVIDGLGPMRGGLVRMREELPRLAAGLGEGAAGLVDMREGIRRIRDGIAVMRAGLGRAADGLDAPGSEEDLSGLAADAAANLDRALDEMHTGVSRPLFDPQYAAIYEEVARAYGDLTGIDDTTGRASSEPGAAEYAAAGGMSGSLRAIAAGLREAIVGLARIDEGLARMDGGLARLGPGLQEGAGGVREVIDGARRMVEGLDRILPGLARLRTGLAEGASRVRSAGFGDPEAAGNLGLTPGLVEAVPGLRERLAFFLSRDERTTRLYVTLEHEPYAEEALVAVRSIREQAAIALNGTPLEGRAVLVAGGAAFFDDIRSISSADTPLLMTSVLGGIFLVLVLLLRSIVAPVYLVATVMLSFLTTLGLTTLVFEGILGHEGLPWWLPPFLFVMLVALGADYNIFLMSRIREEAGSHTTAAATARGLALTGHVITSAGLILAGTFAALMAAPLRSLQAFGFAVTAGILMDTFIVRSLLVPALSTLLGRHNWWPSRRARTP